MRSTRWNQLISPRTAVRLPVDLARYILCAPLRAVASRPGVGELLHLVADGFGTSLTSRRRNPGLPRGLTASCIFRSTGSKSTINLTAYPILLPKPQVLVMGPLRSESLTYQ